MERIYTWIHKNYMKRLEKKASKMGASKYKVAQLLIEKGLDEEQQYAIGLNIVYWYICYAASVTAILFLLVF